METRRRRVEQAAQRPRRKIRPRAGHRRPLAPVASWSTSPGMVAPITASVPDPAATPNESERRAFERALEYMDLKAGAARRHQHRPRLHRLLHQLAHRRSARRRHHRQGHRSTRMSLRNGRPGSQAVKDQAEEEGLDLVFKATGFDWRRPGCSMCLGMNPVFSPPASAAPRPAIAASKAARAAGTLRISSALKWPQRTLVAGHFVDVRNWAEVAQLRRSADAWTLPVHPRSPPLDRVSVGLDPDHPGSSSNASSAASTAVLFFDWRRHQGSQRGRSRSSFVLNDKYAGARSSSPARTSAVAPATQTCPPAALSNSLPRRHRHLRRHLLLQHPGKNGIVLIRLSEEDVALLLNRAATTPNYGRLSLSKSNGHRRAGFHATFEMDPFRKFTSSKDSTTSSLTLRHAAALGIRG